ncbi:Component of the argr regulatory complex [Colletotrichum higginsianum IMI 349063]|uniref:Component of the argr regulatory complex n=1 Tax=Colletotrichum higginsianum (strain IMI 349063) TaxID=759273 RepID=A0A1B7Y8C1_COLHI|nr:Component of the argr regulatory complex [Colletotrichum higginsianum IMI 349063]OBR08175.1 Component of the argr regulatory complex [Colletotrichum higginsianum IMI 349063]
MASPVHATHRRRKRTKTFTGCWTCRSRKVKCDENKPGCHQCNLRGLECGGYGIRLQWLPPETAFTPGSTLSSPELAREVPTTSFSRRQIAFPPFQKVLSWGQVDGILRLIDSFKQESASSGCDDVVINIDAFGVFGTAPLHDAFTVTPLPEEGSECLDSETQSLTCLDSPESQSSRVPVVFPSPSQSETAAAWELCNLHENQKSRPFIYEPKRVEIGGSDLTLADPSRSEAEELSVVATTSPPDEHYIRRRRLPGLSQTPKSLLSEQERFLMHHYMYKVVNIFCVIDNMKSPWKTIHLPRAIQGAGELSIIGTTSRIRSALRNALLSISAYYFSNTQALESQHDEWVEAAARYRYRAIGLLKEAVELDLHSPGRPKYKESLATMLSMTTINVMSGDTSTCRLHLDGAHQLIIHMGRGKPKLSAKARALHRIYFYLRVIYESTAASQGSASRFSAPKKEQCLAPQPEGVMQSPMRCPDEDSSSASTEPVHAANEMASFECIYGIPQSLLVLLKRAIDLLDRIEGVRNKNDTPSVSTELERACDTVERDIFDWPLEEELARYRDANIGVSFGIIYHQTHAFHNALIIYFSQNIRLLSHRYMRQYVQAVLHDIESIEAIKSESGLLAAPLFWPSFMAASEAFDESLQDRFKMWYEKVAIYGIKAVRTGTQVLDEVWKRGPSSESRTTSQWRSIVGQKGTTLMLT